MSAREHGQAVVDFLRESHPTWDIRSEWSETQQITMVVCHIPQDGKCDLRALLVNTTGFAVGGVDYSFDVAWQRNLQVALS